MFYNEKHKEFMAERGGFDLRPGRGLSFLIPHPLAVKFWAVPAAWEEE
jgi:hypothetical protein